MNESFFLRDVIGNHMRNLGELNPQVVLVNADLMGTCRNKSFAEAFPDRSFNVGIAEQNLVSFAAGLAHEGFIPYAFTMAPFMSMRACEQCRTDVAYMGLNVRLISTYAGYSGGISGATHWGLEDCAIMSAIPGMTVIEPSDPFQAKQLMDLTLSYQGPIYLRSSVEPTHQLYSGSESFEIGKASILSEGDDGAIIASGITVQFAVEAARIVFRETGKSICVVDMHTLKPVDKETVVKVAKSKRIITVQDHSVIGGLGSFCAGILAENGIACQFKILGCVDQFIPMAHAPYLYHQFEMDAEGIAKNMILMLQKDI